MRDTLWDIVRTPKAQKWLVRVAASSAALLVLTYVFYARGGFNFAVGILWSVFMLVSTQLLSISVRRITTLPDEYLDERQRKIRDKAFRLTHRGFAFGIAGMWALYGIAYALWKLGPLQTLDQWVNSISFGIIDHGGRVSQNFWQWLIQWIWADLSSLGDSTLGNVMLFGIVLWAFWVTPLAVIAWDEAKHGGGVKRD